MKLEHISLNHVLSFERGVHLFDFSSLYFSSSSFNFSLYFFVLSLLELMIYAIIYTSYERDVIYFVSTWNILPTMLCSYEHAQC